MNRLQFESSPYLLQHAHNPVDWYPWGTEALEKARQENKPILVSIGYSTCHWCHVMERESFMDPDVAGLMNEYFVNIKIDREERPDLDQLYMDACQVIAGNGGWPLNVFLTPEGRPFFAGTYFPPQPGFKRMSWPQALEYAAYNFFENREAVERQATRIADTLQRAEKQMTLHSLADTPVSDPFPGSLAEALFLPLHSRFDREEGGFDLAPKFPNTMALEFLLHYAVFSGRKEPWQHVAFSLLKMLRGGIFDQLGGGIARYATDRRWLVPHFEKMLYDNALFARLLADAYRYSPDAGLKEGLEATLGFISREMTSPEGGFYSALDADTQGEEGGYYTWYPDEIKTILGEDAEWFMEYFGVTEAGNWEGKNILHRSEALEDFAQRKGLDLDFLNPWMNKARQDLLELRNNLPRPHRDEKILLGWNALMCNGFIQAYQALGNPAYREIALQNLDYLLRHFLQPDGVTLWHSSMGEKTSHPGFLNDYAFFIEALLDAYSLDLNTDRLHLALRLAEHVIQHFYDPEDKLFFFAPKDQDDLFMRRKELYDAEMPSGIAAMIGNLQRLSAWFERRDFRSIAQQALLAVQNTVKEDPFPFARYATAILPEIYGFSEIAVVGPDAHEGTNALMRHLLPGSVWMAAEDEDRRFPLLAGRKAGNQTQYFLCRNDTCQQPVGSPEALLDLFSDGKP